MSPGKRHLCGFILELSNGFTHTHRSNLHNKSHVFLSHISVRPRLGFAVLWPNVFTLSTSHWCHICIEIEGKNQGNSDFSKKTELWLGRFIFHVKHNLNTSQQSWGNEPRTLTQNKNCGRTTDINIYGTQCSNVQNLKAVTVQSMIYTLYICIICV